MSHRDNMIKKNKELSNPMDIFNIGFVGALTPGTIEKGVEAGGRSKQSDRSLVDFTNSSTNSSHSTMIQGRKYHAGVSSGDGIGVWAGGDGSTYNESGREKADFQNSSVRGTFGTLNTGAYLLQGVSNPPTGKGIFASGGASGASYYTGRETLDFSNSSVNSGFGTVATARSFATGCSSNDGKGCFAGGRVSGGSGTNTREIVDFSNSGTNSSHGTMNTYRKYVAGVSSGDGKGCFGGGRGGSSGSGGSYLNTRELIDFANSGTNSSHGTLTGTRQFLVGMSNGVGSAMFVGGWNSSVGGVNTRELIDFSNSSINSTHGTLPYTTYHHASTSML